MDLNHLRPLAGLVVAAMVAAGCSGTSAPSASPEDPPTEEDTASPSEEGTGASNEAGDGNAPQEDPYTGTDDDGGTDDGDRADLDGDLPPTDALALGPLYGAALEDHGVELTDRGGLIDRTDGYEVSPDGTHLALYVSPVGERSDEQYLDGIVELAQVFLPEVFDRWPGLESFDICQEASPEQVEEGYSPIVTQIDISREAAATIDWTDASLADLYASELTDDGFSMTVFGDLRDHDRVLTARSEARARFGSNSAP